MDCGPWIYWESISLMDSYRFSWVDGLLNQKLSINSLSIVCCVFYIQVIMLLELSVYILHVCTNVSSE
jgi:hypothetical protein